MVSSSVFHIKCANCEAEMNRQLPSLNGPAEVRETIDKLSGVEWKQDQKEILKGRRDDYYWSVEVPRMVNSGKYSAETMLENGWIYIDDKGQVHTHTKPPGRR